nr:uroporphyrinogen decarboxylase family protein [Candidatus Sigynarchaeota archaeon]
MLLDFMPLNIPISFAFSANWYFMQSNGKIFFTKDAYDAPELKIEMDRLGARLRHEFLPEMFKDPSEARPSVNLGIGLATIPHFLYDARAVYYKNQDPWTDTLFKPGENPLEVVKALDEHQVEERFAPLAVIRDSLVEQYGAAKISIGPPDQQGPMNLFFRLCGECVFHYMVKKKAIAHELFGNITRTFINSHKYFRTLLHGMKPGQKTVFQVAECCSYLESPRLVEEFNVKYDNQCAAELGPMRLHSCGESTANLEAFSKLGNITWAEFGFGTDLKKARRLLGPVDFSCRIAPKRLLSLDQGQIRADVEYIIDGVKGGPSSICSVGVDHGTPRENLLAAMSRVKQYNDEKALEEGE